MDKQNPQVLEFSGRRFEDAINELIKKKVEQKKIQEIKKFERAIMNMKKTKQDDVVQKTENKDDNKEQYDEQYNMFLRSLTNDTIRDYVQKFFKSKSQRITNLNRNTKEQLISLFPKYDIPKIPYDINNTKEVKQPGFIYDAKTKKVTYDGDKSFEVNTEFVISEWHDINEKSYGRIVKITPCYVTYNDDNNIERKLSTKKFIHLLENPPRYYYHN
jgi:hypothetical protein